MIAKIVYASPSKLDIISLCQIFHDNNFIVDKYDENYYVTRKKALLTKASCGTKLSPLIAIYDDNKELIKAFYAEDNSNNIESIQTWVNLNKGI